MPKYSPIRKKIARVSNLIVISFAYYKYFPEWNRTTRILSRCIYADVKYSERRKRYSHSYNYPDNFIYNANVRRENSSSIRYNHKVIFDPFSCKVSSRRFSRERNRLIQQADAIISVLFVLLCRSGRLN